MKIDGYSKHTLTHSLWGKGGRFDRHTLSKIKKLKKITLIEEEKKKRKKKQNKKLSLYVLLTSDFTHKKFQKVC